MNKSGLTTTQVQERIAQGKQNIPFIAPSKTEKQIIKENIFTRFNALNAFLALLVLLVSVANPKNLVNLAFMGLVIVNSVIGIIQEIRAKRTVDRLSLITEPQIDVWRENKRQTIRSAEIVLDDIIILSAGKQVPVDGIFLEGEGFEINESLLTGEADAVTKKPGEPIYSGSFVISGEAFVHVTKISGDTYAASISKEIKGNKRKNSQIVLALNDIIRLLSLLIIPIGILLFSGKFFIIKQNISLSRIVISTVAALVGMIPEGLMLMTSIAFAVSVVLLGRQKTLVQTLSSIETLARIDTICLDKTGTITSGEMDCLSFYPLQLSQTGAVSHKDQLTELHCHTETIRKFYQTQGSMDDFTKFQTMLASQKELNPTQMALNKVFLSEQPESHTPDSHASEDKSYTKVQRTIPFHSQRKWLGACFADQTTHFLGAPEFVLSERQDLKYALNEMIERQTTQGYRVLLWAKIEQILPEDNLLTAAVAQNLIPLALISIADRIRPEAAELFNYFRQQNVQIKLISGDHPQTVAALAQRADLQNLGTAVDMSGVDPDDQEKLTELVNNHHVFGRVTPVQKRKLLQALQSGGHVVAMTGDGVNDVLALKDADCGIAMAAGSDAARAVADIVLLDNNLENIVSAVYEGRRVINNIERVATLFLVKTVYSFLLALTYILLPMPFPIFPIQISMLSTLTIGIPSFVLALKPNKERVSGRFIEKVFLRCVPGGLTAAIMVIFMQLLGSAFRLPPDRISSLCAMVLALSGFYMLWQVCHPWDKQRKLLWGLCVATFILEIIFLPNIFRMASMHNSQTWMFLLPLILYFPLYRCLEKLFYSHRGRRFREKLQKTMQKLKSTLNKRRQNHA